MLCRANKSPFWKGWQHLLEAPAHCERPRGENRGPDHAEAVAVATESYVLSLAHLDVQMAVRQVNLDSGVNVGKM